MASSRDFLLPDLGEGLTESEIVSWHVKAGDTVVLNQILAEVETAKAVVELPSPLAGIVAVLHAEPGDTVNVGEPIVSITVPEDVPQPDAERKAEPAERKAEPPGREPVLVGYGAALESSRRRPRFFGHPTADVSSGQADASSPSSQPASLDGAKRNPRATPPVRKLARELGVDLASIAATGAGGLITRADVERSSETLHETAGEETPSPANSSALSRRETRTTIRGVRKAVAAAMVHSATTAPHVTEFLTVDVSESLDLINRIRATGGAVNMLALTAKALSIAVRDNPTLNSHWDEAAQELVQFHYINLGIAVATDRGLVVPNVKDSQSLDLVRLASAIRDLAGLARQGKLTPTAMAGGTITITNVGVFGVDAGTPILNTGESAILAIGAVRQRPWVHKGELAVRSLMTLSLSFDHRVVDGEQGSKFLVEVGSILQDPAMVLAMV